MHPEPALPPAPRTRLRMARARLTTRATLPDYLPARMLNEFVYCPRLFFYEWVDGLFAHSADTIEGAQRHERHDKKDDALPEPGAEERIHARSVQLASDTHGLIAKMDLIEGDGTAVTPLDYKRGAPQDTDAGPEAWPADRAQLCVQALILREHGYSVVEAVAYYYETKQRVRVAIDEALVGETLGFLQSARAVAESGSIPPPLVDSPKCSRCSLVGICLPDETRRAMFLEPDTIDAQLSLFEPVMPAPDHPLHTDADALAEVRRLVPARDDLRPLYVTGYALTVGKSGEVLQVREKGKLIQEVRMHEISQVNAFGSVTVTGPALQALCWAEKPVAQFTFGHWFAGLTTGLGLKNVFLRIAQVRGADNAAFSLNLARDIVATKIRNQRTLLQRNHVEPSRFVLARLKQLAEAAGDAGSQETLLGIAGSAALLRASRRHGEGRRRRGSAGIRVRSPQPASAARSDQCPPFVRLQSAGEGPDDCVPRGWFRSIHRVLPPAAVRASGARSGSDGRVQTARRRFDGALGNQYADGDGERLRSDRAGGRADRVWEKGIPAGVRAADGHSRDASGVRLSYLLPPGAGGPDAALGACGHRRVASVSGVRDAVTRASGEVTTKCLEALATNIVRIFLCLKRSSELGLGLMARVEGTGRNR